MPLISASTRMLQVKIVFYGPGLSGKTTNLEQLAHTLEPSRIGELMSLDTTGDRTLFFDWMPVDLGKIKGFDVKVQLFTVPGQVRYNNTRKKVLQGADGVVFVADSQEEALDQNRFSFQNLRENLAEEGIDLEDVPLVIQWNKCDLPSALTPQILAAKLNLEHYPQVRAIASQGIGVKETLRQITQLTLNHVKADLRMGTEPTPREASVPMDGDAMLSSIMSGGGSEGATDPGIRSATTDHLLGLEAQEEHAILGEPGESEAGVAASVAALKGDLRSLGRALRELTDQLPRRVSDVVEREVEPIAAKLADLESRLGILQRVVNRLGGRMDAVERRVARLEVQERQPGGRSDELREMAGHVHDLSRLMAAFARRLGHPGGGQERAAGSGPDGVEAGAANGPARRGSPGDEH